MFENAETKTILIVDEDDVVRSRLARMLEAAGYVAEGALSGPDALDYLASHPQPGLILLNLMMPMRNAWVFRPEAGKPRSLAGIPIALFSSLPGNEPVAYDPCVPNYVDCPLRPERLFEVVRRCCGNPAGAGYLLPN